MSEILIVDTTNADDYDFNANLTSAINGFNFEQATISHHKAAEEINRINASRGVVLAGVPFHYPFESAADLRPNLELWLPNISVPILGICLGHQAIGIAYGATMRREEEVEAGLRTAEIMKEFQDDPIFKGLGRRFKIDCLHRASLAIKTGPDAKLLRLARSLPKEDVSASGCENQIIRVAGKQIYGAQFHPENSESGNYSNIIHWRF